MGREYLNRGFPTPQAPASFNNPFPIGMLCTSAPISNSILRESALCPYPLLLCTIMKSTIQAIQPNYSLIRLYPDLQFVFDVMTGDLVYCRLIILISLLFFIRIALFLKGLHPSNLHFFCYTNSTILKL